MDSVQILKRLKERKNSLEFQTRMHTGLISHNYIVEVGANTVCSVDGKAALKPINGSKLPSQWTLSGVKEIQENCGWTNMLGDKMQITAITYKEWYAKELKSINETIEMFEPLVK